MSSKKRRFERRGPSGEVALIALALEARARGMSYGQLVSRTSPEEQEKIVQDYREKKATERRTEKKGK